MPRAGSLTIVGLGIQFPNHITTVARTSIKRAQKVLALTSDPVTLSWVRDLNPATESLDACYTPGTHRHLIYTAMADRIMSCVRKGLRVCVVSYGHPGVLVDATHDAMRQARAEGYAATMHPGISSLDCLLADLGIDPGDFGYQTYEATNFLLYKRRFDKTIPLILFQIGVTGELKTKRRPTRYGLQALTATLAKQYGPEHEVVIYEAAQLPVADTKIRKMPLRSIATARMSTFSTLYIPAKRRPKFDSAMFKRLRLDRQIPSSA